VFNEVILLNYTFLFTKLEHDILLDYHRIYN